MRSRRAVNRPFFVLARDGFSARRPSRIVFFFTAAGFLFAGYFFQTLFRLYPQRNVLFVRWRNEGPRAAVMVEDFGLIHNAGLRIYPFRLCTRPFGRSSDNSARSCHL